MLSKVNRPTGEVVGHFNYIGLMKFSFVAIGIIWVSLCLAQDRKITARVVTPENEPVANANVLIDGTSTLAVTNAKGYFELTAPSGSTLTISHVGYSTQRIQLPDADKFQVLMRKEVVLLETVALTAYPKKVLLTSGAQPLADTLKKELAAAFPKGIANFYILAGNALHAEFKDYKGPLSISFTIDVSGKMTNIHASDTSLTKAIISDWKYLPAWKPAMQRGVKVPQTFILPVVASEPDDFYKYIVENMIIPPKALRRDLDGQSFVSFVASKDGKISEVKAVKSLSVDYDLEITTILTATPPEIVKSLISITGATKFMAIFRFEIYPNPALPELAYPSVMPEEYILGEMEITSLKRKKVAKPVEEDPK